MAGTALGQPFFTRHHLGVDLSANQGLGVVQRVDHLAEAGGANRHHVHVAVRRFRGAGHRTEHERHFQLISQGLQGSCQHIVQTSSIANQRRKLREDRVLRVRAELGLVAYFLHLQRMRPANPSP